MWPAVAVLRALTATPEDEERCDEQAYELLLKDIPPTRALGWLLEDEEDTRLNAAAQRLSNAGHHMTTVMLKLACQLIAGGLGRSPEQRVEMISILLTADPASREKVKAVLADGNPSRFLDTDKLPPELTSTMSELSIGTERLFAAISLTEPVYEWTSSAEPSRSPSPVHSGAGGATARTEGPPQQEGGGDVESPAKVAEEKVVAETAAAKAAEEQAVAEAAAAAEAVATLKVAEEKVVAEAAAAAKVAEEQAVAVAAAAAEAAVAAAVRRPTGVDKRTSHTAGPGQLDDELPKTLLLDPDADLDLLFDPHSGKPMPPGSRKVKELNAKMLGERSARAGEFLSGAEYGRVYNPVGGAAGGSPHDAGGSSHNAGDGKAGGDSSNETKKQRLEGGE